MTTAQIILRFRQAERKLTGVRGDNCIMQGAIRGTRTCIYCKQEKNWIYSGLKLKDGSKVYIDEAKHRWSGRRCPDCEKARVQAAVRCDSFDKEIIARGLDDQGYQLKSKQLPLIAEKDGLSYKVTIRRAYAEDGKVVIETPVDPKVDLVALVFESVRIVPREQLERLGNKLMIYGSPALEQKQEDPVTPSALDTQQQSLLDQRNTESRTP